MLKVYLDKARYYPEDKAVVSIDLTGLEIEPAVFKGVLTIVHLGKKVSRIEKHRNKLEKSMKFKWLTPKINYRGYLLNIKLFDKEGRVLANENSALDVSSDWTKFPRYGYLTNFSSEVDTNKIIEEMNYWQLNSIEYYDWKFLHHQLLPPDRTMEWEDWAGRKIDGNIVKSYIENAREHNMVSMSYNMIYAGTNNYADYGIKEEWGLWYAFDNRAEIRKGDRFTFHMGDSPSNQSELYFFDISNAEWQKYIIDKNMDAILEMGFDGWHGDTVGEWGEMWTTKTMGNSEQTVLVKDSYKDFLNTAKKRMGQEYYLSFNPVGAQGIEQVNASNVDVLYAEIWPWDKNKEGFQYNTYMSLKRVIDQARKESGGKSLIVPAYMEYTRAAKVEHEAFNMSAVLLTDATVYAAGGSRIEIGDGQHMLSNEYFPKKNLYMNEEHKERQKQLQDFIVAYENLLRDGLEDNKKVIVMKDYEVSSDGKANTIWAYSKENEEFETVQLINLLEVSCPDWRAAEGIKEKPLEIKDITIKYYTNENYKDAFVTSPDPYYRLESKSLSFEYKDDETGIFLEITVPSLEYWDMIYFVK